MSPYQELEDRFRRISVLGEALGVLHWDQAVMMPTGGASLRAEQLATLRVIRHDLLCDPRIPELLDDARSDPAVEADPWRQANLREMRRKWIHASAVEPALVAASSHANSACEMAWREARPANDFASVAPRLREVLAIVREIAAAKAEALGCTPYDALLDQYEPGGRAMRIDALFDDLAAFLPGFLEDVLARQEAHPVEMPLAGPFPVRNQRALAHRLMEALGFDFGHGRLDVSLHPFCGGAPGDIRITTRYNKADFAESLMGVLHETGHALYEMNRPAAWRHQPVGEARGMALHESQSLIVEMQACRSREFLEFVAPLIREAFEAAGPAWDAENLYRHYRKVARSLIRVDADEVTYPAHVILRYRLERELLAGYLDVDDIPAAWNDGMEQLLGIRPADDTDGCLQDIHWYDGDWGYFPTYTMGALAAAQLFDAAKRAKPEIPAAIARGNFAPLIGWLRDNVHAKGSLKTTDEILTEATGAPLGAEKFKQHLKARYLED